MFLPLHDGVPLRHLKAPIVTRMLLGLCIGVYLITFLVFDQDELVAGLGLIPSVLLGTEILPAGYPFVPVSLTPFTALFVHVGFLHLAGNMLFLWVFGDNVEDAMGHGRFCMFFLLCGLAANLTHVLVLSGSHRPLIGASGARRRRRVPGPPCRELRAPLGRGSSWREWSCARRSPTSLRECCG